MLKLFNNIWNTVAPRYRDAERNRHSFKGGVTGGYIVQGFNPQKERKHFQKVCDFLLDRRAEHLGQKKREDKDFHVDQALRAAMRQIQELRLNLQEAAAFLDAQAPQKGETVSRSMQK